MNIRKNYLVPAIAALSGASMLALAASPASALTLPGPTMERAVAASQVDLAGWHGDHGWGHRDHDGWRHRGYHGYWGHGYNWGPGYWESGYPSGPCAIFGGVIQCF